MTARIAFFGTPEVAAVALDVLLTSPGFEVVAAVTNPDRARGRSRQPMAPPVKLLAQEAGLEVLQPEQPAEIVDRLAAMDLDAVAVVAYGRILPQPVLAAGGRGFVNLHFSLLPRWRGAAPVQAAIRAGDEVTGVTCFVLDQGMDTGPVLRQAATPIGPTETAGSLLARLATLGAPVLADALQALVAGEAPRAQTDDGATLAAKIHPGDVAIDFAMTTASVDRLVRSANPAPGAHTTFRGRRLKVWQVLPADHDGPLGAPGAVLARSPEGTIVATGDGAVVLVEVQPEGKARMSGADFANGHQPGADDRFGA